MKERRIRKATPFERAYLAERARKFAQRNRIELGHGAISYLSLETWINANFVVYNPNYEWTNKIRYLWRKVARRALVDGNKIDSDGYIYEVLQWEV